MSTDRTPLDRILVVGASLAGLRAAETLRHEGHEGEIVLVGGEPHMPYDRPPLSKKVLAGEWDSGRVWLRRPDDVGSLDLNWRLGTPASALDLGRRVVTVGDEELDFDGLVIATGAAPKMLPGMAPTDGDDDTPMVTVLRTIDDSLALRDRIRDGDARVVVVGAGFIGLEVAATARNLGNEVVVLEGGEAPLMRALGADMGRAASAFHADHGVTIRCGVEVSGLADGGVEVRVDGDTEVVPADVVVVGVGVAPCTEWLDGSGIEIDDGVVCDETLLVRAGDGVDTTAVVAAGDVVRWRHPLYDEEMRIEHWSNAAEQGAAAAKTLLASARGDDPEPYDSVPFFWSDQYDRRIQCLGRTSADDEVRIVHGSPEDRRFLALYGREGRLRAAMGLNLPKLVMPYRGLLADRISWDDALAHAAQQQLPS